MTTRRLLGLLVVTLSAAADRGRLRTDRNSPVSDFAQPAMKARAANPENAHPHRAHAHQLLKEVHDAHGRIPTEHRHMSFEQHVDVGARVRSTSPSMLLVWGLGYDSVAFTKLNIEGTTRFVEAAESHAWKRRAEHLRNVTNADITVYRRGDLGTRVDTWREFAEHPHHALKVEGSPINGTCWDTVVVNAPGGHAPNNPGRAVPIYTAFRDVRRCIDGGDSPRAGRAPLADVVIYVHDFQRELEEKLTRKFQEEYFPDASITTIAGSQHPPKTTILGKVTIPVLGKVTIPVPKPPSKTAPAPASLWTRTVGYLKSWFL